MSVLFIIMYHEDVSSRLGSAPAFYLHLLPVSDNFN